MAFKDDFNNLFTAAIKRYQKIHNFFNLFKTRSPKFSNPPLMTYKGLRHLEISVSHLSRASWRFNNNKSLDVKFHDALITSSLHNTLRLQYQ